MRTGSRTATCIVSATALLAASGYGVYHGIRASIAQAIYHEAKYGAAKDDPNRICRLCEEAYQLYPHNYYFYIWAAENAYYSSFGVDKEEQQTRLNMAERWCDTGLGLNQYKSQLRLLKTRLIERESVPDAIEYWEEYVDWQFWEPYNHAVLAELYAKAGDFEKAFDCLEWVKGSQYYGEAAAKIKEAWDGEMTPPRAGMPQPKKD